MGYRSLKRVLGETSLERKCRLLFGICLSILIIGAFWFVEYKAESMVMETTRRKARDLIDLSLVWNHFEFWVTDPEVKVQGIIEGLDRSDYRYEVLAYDRTTDPVKLAIMRELEAELKRKLAEQQQNPELSQMSEAEADRKHLVVSKEMPLAEKGEYHYFQTVYYDRDCFKCHFRYGVAQKAAASGEETDLVAVPLDEQPFRVMQVVLPYADMKGEINMARAWLIAVGILTVFLSMVGLYGIVRYVIVKPLKHLRDVSDEISRGNTDLRADIQTNDEFEELAASFNRMLRHLTDTQAELQQVNVDLDAKVDQLAQLNMRLYEMNRLKSDFLANMSHELRTPLNSIIGFSEVLQGISSLTDKQRRYAQNIQKSGRLLLEMINDILDLAKMESGKMEVRPSEFRIDAIVHAQCDMVRSLTEEKNIDLEAQVSAELPPLYQDQGKVQQILTNLLSNAIKFTPEGGRITVRARRDDQERLQLIVDDTGVGIAEEDREIIFEKFRQSSAVLGQDGLTREYSGTGLGLSIVKELCKLLGGEISFESEVGKGSSFQVMLPWVLARGQRVERELNRIEEQTRLQRDELPAATAPVLQSPTPHLDSSPSPHK